MSLHNLLVYSLQIAIVLATGGILLHLLRLEQPRTRLICWQLLIATCLLLPLLEPWQTVASSGPVGGVSIRVTKGVATGARTAGFNFERALLLILLAGMAFRFASFAVGLIRLQLYRHRSRLHATCEPGVEVRVSDEIAGPATFGVIRPVVLLPQRWLGNPAILHHELVHVRRRDWLFMLFEELLRAVFWFHPLIWYAIGQIQLAREEVVDREVVLLLQSRDEYLQTLVAIAAAKSGLDLAPAPLFLRKRHLRRRVASLMKEVHMSKFRLNSSLAAMLMLTVAAGAWAVYSFPLQAAQEDKDERVVEVGGNAQALKLIKKVTPKYPQSAKENRIQGVVRLSALIAKDGTVKDLNVLEGDPELAEASVKAVREWVYETTLLNGEPVAVKTHIDVNFTLSN